MAMSMVELTRAGLMCQEAKEAAAKGDRSRAADLYRAAAGLYRENGIVASAEKCEALVTKVS
jgi:hypothetical protein